MNVQPSNTVPSALHAVDIDILRTFLAIAETSSFTRAAEKVGRTPSAVSMQIKKLEETIGRSVFIRDSRSVRLTQEGEMLAGYAKRLVALSNEMMAKFITPELEGTVVFGAPDDYGQRVVPEVLKRFSQSHPNVRVDVIIESSTYLIERFDRGEMDVMLFTAQSDVRDPRDEVLLEEELVWAGVKGGAAYTQRPLPLSMWEDCCPWQRIATQALASADIEWRTAYKTAHTLAQRAAIEADLAIAPFPPAFLEDPMVALTQDDGLPPLGAYRICLRTRENPGCCTQAVAEHVMNSFEELS